MRRHCYVEMHKCSQKVKLPCHFYQAKRTGYSQWRDLSVIIGRVLVSLMQRDIWPPTPPSQTTLIRLYQMGVTSPPTTLPSPTISPGHVTQSCGDKTTREGLVNPQDVQRRGDVPPESGVKTVTYTFPMHHPFPALCTSWMFRCCSLPRALHRPSTAHQGCGSHAHTLRDIFALFLSVSILLLLFLL